MTVQNIFDFLNSKYPTETACDFDNVGILVGDKRQTVKKVLIALDCTTYTVDNAISNGCNLIITHHPVIFEPLKSVLKGSVVYKLIENNISVISMHTNLDIGENGVNDSLAKVISPISCVTVFAKDGFPLKKCEISPISADELASILKNKLGGAVKYVSNEKLIKNVLLCSGSGGNYISETLLHECDALITGDVKHNQFLDSVQIGVCLFDAGHFNTENIVVESLKQLLSTEFSSTEFICDNTNYIKNRWFSAVFNII